MNPIDDENTSGGQISPELRRALEILALGGSPRVSEKACSEYTGRKVRTLQGDRQRGGGIPYEKLGGGKFARVVYNLRAVDEWLASRSRVSTTEGEAA